VSGERSMCVCVFVCSLNAMLKDFFCFLLMRPVNFTVVSLEPKPPINFLCSRQMANSKHEPNRQRGERGEYFSHTHTHTLTHTHTHTHTHYTHYTHTHF